MSTKTAKKSSAKAPSVKKSPLGIGGGQDIYFYWKINPVPPSNVTQGTDWVVIAGPNSQEEDDREYCAILHTPPGGTAAVLQDAEGDTGYPFDGSTFLVESLVSGSHTFTATAIYSDKTDNKDLTVIIP